MTEEPGAPKEDEMISIKEFLETVPPGKMVAVGNLAISTYRHEFLLILPTLQLHCEAESCNGIRFFDSSENEDVRPNQFCKHFITYVCKNCNKTRKTYALWSLLSEDESNGKLFKFGEHPPFGPPIPTRVITLFGSEREYYLKGRISENQGLGIASFAYYRRVIENQKSKIFDEIIRVSEKIGAEPELISDLNLAKKETQFSKAVSEVKHVIPQALLINGHNPLTLLHSALSEGLHAQTDEQCLELATSIRVILTDFVEKVANAIKDEAEINDAVSRLLQQKQKPSKDG